MGGPHPSKVPSDTGVKVNRWPRGRNEPEAPGASAFRLPRQEDEAYLFGIVDCLQDAVAASAARCSDLADVPLWTTQIAIFALSLRMPSQLAGPDVRSFAEFARKCAEYGSRVFPDRSIWPADKATLDTALGRMKNLEAGQLLVLVGRTLDYGRTIEWTRDGDSPTTRRNLVTAKSQGIFYTPAFIARHLASRCLPARRRELCPTVCDPAMGGGVFLLTAAERLLQDYEPTVVRASLFGTDTDPVAVEVAAILIEAMCGTWEPGAVPDILNKNLLIGDAFGGPIDGGEGLPGSIDWATAFPSVFTSARPGFDVVLINPPFGRHKIDSDWLIAKEMRLDKLLLENLRDSGRRRAIDLRKSGFFPLSSIGVLDKSRIGLERAMQLTTTGGNLGAVVPSTIAGDAHSLLLRSSLLSDWSIGEINEFPETARLFYDVSQSVSILCATKGVPTEIVRVRSGVKLETDLSSEFTTEWPVALLRKVSPKLAIPLRVGDPTGVLGTIHHHPPLRDMAGLTNARGEVDVSAFEHALTNDESAIPLVRGDQIDCFRSDLPSAKKSFIDADEFAARLQRSPKFEHYTNERLAGRQCSYLYRHKRLSFAHVPAEYAVANSCNYLSMPSSPSLLLYVLALLNSSLLNWRFKVTNSNNHVANAELDELPIPDPLNVADAVIAELCELAQSLSLHADPAALARLDELVFKLYGLSVRQADYVTEAEAST